MQLREYQTGAIERCRQVLRDGGSRMVLQAATGSGKTVIAVAMIKRALAKGKRVLLTAHRRELIRQPFCKLLRYGVAPSDVGVILAGVGAKPQGEAPDDASDAQLWDAYARKRQAPVQVASIATLRRRTKPAADLIIIDEAHRAMSKSYRDLLELYPDAVVIGLTATPRRADGKGLGELFEELVTVASYKELASRGYLVEPRVYSTGTPDLKGVKTTAGDYNLADLAERCDSAELVGNLVEHYEKLGNDAPALAFAVNVAHSKHIAAVFNAAGIAAAHVDGSTPTAERDAIFAKLSSGELRVVANCDVATEGTDIPAVKTVIMCRPTKSLRVYLQQAGRGSRPHGDTPFVILDHAGNALQHGLPQDERTWSLSKTKKRSSAAQLMGWKCTECLCVNTLSAKRCEDCGAARPLPRERELRHRDGVLVELLGHSGNKWDVVVAQWHVKNRSRAVPLAPGWCYVRYKELFRSPAPRGVELPIYTPEQQILRDRYDRLRAIAQQRGRSSAWVFAQMKSQSRAIDDHRRAVARQAHGQW